MAKLKSGSRVYGDFTVDTTLLVTTDATIVGNLNVRGNVTTVNSTTITVVDPIASFGGGANGAALLSNDGKDRGIDFSYYDDGAKEAFMGWKNGSNTFVLASNATITNNQVSGITYGDLHMGIITADGGGLSNVPGASVTGIVASANYAAFAGNVTTASQPNITSTGTLTGLTVSGTSNIAALNANGVVNVTNSTASTSTTDGALVVAGGAGIGGNLYIGGTIYGNISGSMSAPGSNSQIVFNDSGTSNATSGFTFNKTGNVVNIGSSIELSGDTGEANLFGYLNMKSTSFNVLNDQSLKGIELYSENVAQLNFNNTSCVKVNTTGISLDANGHYANLLSSNGQFAVSNSFSAAGGNLTVDQTGNVDAKKGTFTSIIDSALTSTRLVVAGTGGELTGDSSLTYASGLLSSTNLKTGDANITGTVKLAGHTAGNLLTTDGAGNLVDSNVSFSTDTLTVVNANVTNTATVGNLEITSLTTTGGLLFTGSASGNVAESTNLTFTTGTNTLSTTNINASGNIVADKVTSNSLTATQLVFTGASKELTTSAGLSFASDTLSANNITSSGHIRGNTVQVENLGQTEIAFGDTNGNILGDASFTYTSGTSTLAANNVVSSSSITAAKVTANNISDTTVPYANVDHTLVSDASFTYNAGTSTLSANNVSVSVNVTAGNLYANSGTVKATTLTGTLSTAAQPNVTSLGNLTVANVTGNLQAGGVLTDNLYYANGATWDLQQAAGTDTQVQYNDGNNFAASSNFTFNGTTSTLTVAGTGNITTVNATTVTATTGNITTVNATTGNITTVNATTGNITTVNVTDIEASGNANISGWLNAADTVITGNLTVTGTTTSVNTTTTQLTDPLFELGGGANGAALSTNDAFDRGLVMHTRIGGTNKDLFMGWDTSNAEFVLAKSVTLSDNVVTLAGANAALQEANLGDLRLSNIFAFNANFGGVVFSEGNVTLGAGSYLNGDVNGNISGDITVTGGSGAIQFADSSNLLVSDSDLNFNSTSTTLTVGDGSTTGTIVSKSLTGTLTTAAQPNVTSVGTLTSLDVTNAVAAGSFKSDVYQYANGSPIDFQTAAGNSFELQFHADGVNDLAASSKLTFTPSTGALALQGSVSLTGSANITGANVVSATLFTGSGANLTNINGANVSEVALAGHVTAADQGNITSVGTLTSLSVTGSITSASGDITATLGNVSGNVITGTTLTGTLSTAAQPNITSVGTLTSLSVGTITSTGDVYANTGTVGALYLKGDGYQISNIAGANVTGYVPNAAIANVAYAVNAGNLTGTTLASGVVSSSLTSVGTLTSLDVTGDITSVTGKVLAGQIGNASSYLYGDGSNISGVTASSIAAANITGNTLPSTIINSSLTSVGTLSALTVSGLTDLGAVGNVKVTGGTSGQYLQTNGSGVLSWSTVELSNIHNGNSNVNIASSDGNVTVAVNGSGIITIATTGLTATGIITATGNITAANIISNAYIIANSTTDAVDAITGAITTAGGISAQGNIYTGNVVGFAHGGANTDSAAYIKYNATSGSLDFIFD